MADTFKRLFVLLLASFIFLPGIAAAQDKQQSQEKSELTQKYWADFMHYSLIGNFDLAKHNAQLLVNSEPDPVQVLDLAENSRYADAYRSLSLLQSNTNQLKDEAAAIVAIVEKGRYLRRQDNQRIADEIKRLSSTTRGNMLAVARLKDSGEWAIPLMVQALRDPDRREELEVIKRALPQIGRVAVNPLTVAMHYCDDLNLKLIIAEVLGEIGYHAALPYLQEIVENDSNAPELIEVAKNSVKKITSMNSLPEGISSALLYEKLANDYYNETESLRVPQDQDIANVWFWDNRKGLVKEEVVRESFDELMAMRYTEHALRRDSDLSGSVALWLSAFFRFESQGYSQPAYFGEGHADADTYALTAGPEYLHRVLLRALNDNNRPVALMAIKAMQRNAGQASLLYDLMGRKPLVDALSYPDRQIRFTAALAIAQILPAEPFESADLVVKILGEAMRQKGLQYAVVIDPDQEARNTTMTALRETYAGGVLGSDSLANIITNVKELPSVDLVVISNKVAGPDLAATLEMTSKLYRVAFCPTIVLADSENIPSTKDIVKGNSFVSIQLRTLAPADMPGVASDILSANFAREFSADLADEYALAAAKEFEKLCVTSNKVLPLLDEQNALIDALSETRSEIQLAAINALGSLNSTQGQRALAAMALNEATSYDLRLITLDRLAFSARQFGNLLTTEQVNALFTIADDFKADPDLRNLACQVYGSLNLPSAKVSGLILNQSRN